MFVSRIGLDNGLVLWVEIYCHRPVILAGSIPPTPTTDPAFTWVPNPLVGWKRNATRERRRVLIFFI